MMKFGTVLLMGLCLLLGLSGCSGAGASEGPGEERIVVEVLGLNPSWNLEEMGRPIRCDSYRDGLPGTWLERVS